MLLQHLKVMGVFYVVSAVDMIGLPVWEYHKKNLNCCITHCNIFCNVHIILRKIASFSWENAEQRQPWLGQDAYLYACVFIYMNSELWDFLRSICNRFFFGLCLFNYCIFFGFYVFFLPSDQQQAQNLLGHFTFFFSLPPPK